MKISKRWVSGGSIHNKQNVERYVIPPIILLHFSGITTQEGTLEEKLGHPCLLSVHVY